MTKPDFTVKHIAKLYSKKRKSSLELFLIKQIMRDYLLLVAEDLVKGKRVSLPYSLGDLVVKKLDVRKRPKNYLPIDFNATKQLKKENPELFKKIGPIRFTNDHTDFYFVKLFWIKFGNPHKNSYYFNFRPIKSLKKLMSISAKEDINKFEDYIPGAL